MAPTVPAVEFIGNPAEPSKRGFPLLNEGDDKPYDTLHKQYAAKLAADGKFLEQTTDYQGKYGQTVRKTRIDPGKQPKWATGSKPSKGYYPFVWQAGEQGSRVIVTEGEKAGAALVSGGKAPNDTIVSVGGSSGFGHSDFSPYVGRHIVFWFDGDDDLEPVGFRALMRNAQENKLEFGKLSMVKILAPKVDAADYSPAEQEEMLNTATRFVIPREQVRRYDSFANTQPKETEEPEWWMERLMQVLPPPGYDEWFRWLPAMKGTGLSKDDAVRWSLQNSKDNNKTRKQINDKWDGLTGTSPGTLRKLLEEEGIVFEQKESVVDSRPTKLISVEERQAERDRLENKGWIMNNLTPYAGSLVNAKYALEELAVLIEYDEWTEEMKIDGEKIDLDTAVGRLRTRMENGFKKIKYIPTKSVVEDAILNIKDENKIDSAKDLLWQYHEEWKNAGKPKLLDSIGEMAFGQNAEELPNAIAAAIIRGQAIRALQPGAIFPYMIIIASRKHGTGKGQALKTLALGEHITGLDLNTQDASKKLQERLVGISICEMDEFDSLNPKELNSLKSIITVQSNKNRLAYRHDATDAKARHIFVATTNKDTFLVDEYNRRHPVLEIPPEMNRIDLKWLRDNKALLFGEAVQEYLDGECWSDADNNYTAALKEELWGAQEEHSSNYRIPDDIEGLMDEFFAGYFAEKKDIPNSVYLDFVKENLRFPGASARARDVMRNKDYRPGQRMPKDAEGNRPKCWRYYG